MNLCPATPTDTALLRDILGAVDCNVQVYAAAGYKALAGPGSPFPAAVTALLVIYIAVLGYRLMFALGRVSLAEAPVIALQVGAVLALTLNWGAFQTLVFNFDTYAPLQIARVISRPMAVGGGALEANLAADPIDGLQKAYDELAADGVEFGKKAGPTTLPSRGGEAAATDTLWRASEALLASTAGVLAVSTIATGVLTAVGPIFIVLFLFDATRGFFIGWLRALVAATLAPLLCWVTTSLMLVIIGPWIDTLALQRQDHKLSLDTAGSAASIVLIFAAAQAALIVAGLIAASGFQLRRRAAPAEIPDVAPAASGGVVAAEPPDTGARTLAVSRGLRPSPALPDRRAVTEAAATAATGVTDASSGAAASAGTSARPARLGETYRRGNVMRDRNRFGAAGGRA